MRAPLLSKISEKLFKTGSLDKTIREFSLAHGTRGFLSSEKTFRTRAQRRGFGVFSPCIERQLVLTRPQIKVLRYLFA